MPAGQNTHFTPRYGASITTVDPSQGIVRGVLKGDAQEREFTIVQTPLAFRWPLVGESWIVENKNNTWYLDGLWPTTEAPITFQDVNSGDLILNTPTGVVHVLGNDSGATDFTIKAGSFPTRGTATLVAGVVVVASTIVTAQSQILLTAQDNNSVGVLRISARAAGVNFTITSSQNTDHGLVAYQIFG